jgi:primosomal protein N''
MRIAVEEVINKLKENLQIIYRKALDADKQLDTLNKDGKGKFTVIFGDDSEFSSRSKRFIPYVEELAIEITALESEKSNHTELLPRIVKKIQTLLVTLEKFKSTI